MFKRIFRSPWPGYVMAIPAVFWEAFWLAGPPMGLVAADADTRWQFAFWGFIAVVVAFGQALIALHRKVDHLEGQLEQSKRIKSAREAIGQLFKRLSEYEREAYNGSDGNQYDKLFRKIEDEKLEVHRIAVLYLDASFESRFLGVNVYDNPLDEATKMHFIARSQGSFWTMYQLLNAWRKYLDKVLAELKP